jgi:hypothetical protein
MAWRAGESDSGPAVHSGGARRQAARPSEPRAHAGWCPAPPLSFYETDWEISNETDT